MSPGTCIGPEKKLKPLRLSILYRRQIHFFGETLLQTVHESSHIPPVQLLDEIRQIIREELWDARLWQDHKMLLFPEEICERLRCSRSTLTRYRHRGLPHYRIGNRIYYRWPEVMDFMQLPDSFNPSNLKP